MVFEESLVNMLQIPIKTHHEPDMKIFDYSLYIIWLEYLRLNFL